MKRLETISCVTVFLAALCFLGWLQTSPNLKDPDGFYHAAMARKVSQYGLNPVPNPLPLTSLQKSFSDHHLLYHLLLVPFVRWFEPLQGLKIAQALFGAAALLAVFIYLAAVPLGLRLLGTAALACNFPFLFRLALPKATPLVVALLIAGLIAFRNRSRSGLFVLSFAFVWTHASFFLLPCALLLISAVEKLAGRQVGRSSFEDIKLTLAAFAGTAAGIVLNPYFPNNISFYLEQLVQIGIAQRSSSVEAGLEWQPLSLLHLLITDAVPVIFFVMALALSFPRRYREQHQLGLLAFAGALLALTLRSQRAVEIANPIIIVSSLPVIASAIRQEHSKRKRRLSFQAAVMVVFIVGVSARDVVLTSVSLAKGLPLSSLSGAGSWLQSNSKPGDLVCNLEWNTFPILFYRLPDRRFLTGLDPRFLHFADARRDETVRLLLQSPEPATIKQMIQDQYGCRFVIVTKDQTRFIEAAGKGFLPEVYSDEEARIYSAG